MPLYEYECDTCGHRFEKIQKFSDPPVDQCPKCGGAVHKLMSSPAFQFKGSGWYITDYARKDTKDGETAKDTKPDKDASKGPSETKENKDAKGTTTEKESAPKKTSDSSSSSTSSTSSPKDSSKGT